MAEKNINQQLNICVGLPGSGKSTFAKQWAEEKPNQRIRVCRDDIRDMLGTYWVPKREHLVTAIETETIVQALSKGYDVIVDATNLRGMGRFTRLPSQLGLLNIEIVKKDFTDVPVEECIKRDENRERKVGKQVIMKMWNKYLNPENK